MDENKDIRETFLEFLEIPRLTASVVENIILNFYEKKQFEVKIVEGKSYDSAPNMRSEKTAVSLGAMD